ncbi:MAG: MFS transporter [Thermomonas sp.]|uniref:MFS transporter n=1 Tax=Thermomonas sp. TaxID=1971895 RepID=UPI0039E46383
MQTPATPLPLAVRLGWAAGQFAIASHMAIVSIYLLYYLTEVLQVPVLLAGLVTVVPRVWNIVTDPLAGVLSDRTRSRWGRRRPWVLAGTLLWAPAFAAMFWLPAGAGAPLLAVMFLLLYLLVNTGVSLYHVPYSAMAPEMVPDYAQRLGLIGYKEMASRLAVLLAISVLPWIVERAATPLQGYRNAGLVFGGVILASGLLVFFATARAPQAADVRVPPAQDGLRMQWRALRRNRPLAVLGAGYLVANMANVCFSGALIYAVTVVHGQPATLMGLLFPAGSLASLASTPLWAWLAARIGKREACIAAYLGLVVCWAGSLWLPGGTVAALVAMMLVFGVFNAGAELLPNAMVPDTVEYDALQGGGRREGAIYGLWVVIQQSGMVLGGVLVSLLLAVVGFHGVDAADAGVRDGLRIGIALLPALLVLVAAWIVRHYPIDATTFEAMRQQLARHAAGSVK